MIDLTKFKPQLVGVGNVDYFLFNHGTVAVEPKIDGVRCVLHKKGSVIRLYSRTGVEYTARFKDWIPLLQGCILADEVVIDGELAVLQDGRVTTASFALRKELDSSLKRVFFAFDLLYVGEECFMEYPLMTRKQHLNLLTRDSDSFMLVPTHCVDNRDDLLAYYKKCIDKFEGIVLKSLKGYVPNSRFHWLKLKPLHTLDLKVIKKELTKDEKMFLYSLEGEGVELNRVISKIDAPIGCLVEVGYESCGERLKFPKILRRIEHGEK